jgi:hypothetical protein
MFVEIGVFKKYNEIFTFAIFSTVSQIRVGEDFVATDFLKIISLAYLAYFETYVSFFPC